MTNKNGTWPHDDIRRAFVAGAKWWEFEKCKATMWNDDVRKAETEAEKRYGSESRPHTTCAAVVEAARQLDHNTPTYTKAQYRRGNDTSIRVHYLLIRAIKQALAELGVGGEDERDKV